MKQLLKDFNREMQAACHPIEPFPVYMFMVIALLCPLIVKILS